MESKRSLKLALLVSICFIVGLTGMAFMPTSLSAGVILKVGTGPVGGNWFPLGAVLSTIVNEKVEGVRAAPTLGGGTSNMKALNAGTQDFSLTIGITNANAWEGKAPFKKKYRNIRSAFNTYINIFHVNTRAETGIRKFEDLKGKRVSPGKKGFTGEVLTRFVLKEYGMSYKDFAEVTLVGYSEGGNLMRDKHLDAYSLITMPPSAAFVELDTFSPVYIFSASPEVIDRMIKKYPGLIKIQLPGGIYRGRPEPLDTFGTPCVFATRKDLPTDVVYGVTKAFWENYKRSWKLNPNFKDYIRPENALSGLAIPLHPGAYKYYKEAGYNIPKKLMPID